MAKELLSCKRQSQQIAFFIISWALRALNIQNINILKAVKFRCLVLAPTKHQGDQAVKNKNMS